MKSTYKKPVTGEWGWLTSVPCSQGFANLFAEQMRAKYEEVKVEKTDAGYIVRYRKPKERK